MVDSLTPERNEQGQLLPGNTANPSGKNGKTPISDALRALLSRLETDDLADKPLTIAQRIAIEWAQKARTGELAAITTLADRVEGKPSQLIGEDPENPFTDPIPEKFISPEAAAAAYLAETKK